MLKLCLYFYMDRLAWEKLSMDDIKRKQQHIGGALKNLIVYQKNEKIAPP